MGSLNLPKMLPKPYVDQENVLHYTGQTTVKNRSDTVPCVVSIPPYHYALLASHLYDAQSL